MWEGEEDEEEGGLDGTGRERKGNRQFIGLLLFSYDAHFEGGAVVSAGGSAAALFMRWRVSGGPMTQRGFFFLFASCCFFF